MDETSRIAAITAERVDLLLQRPFESAKRRTTVAEVVRVTARLHSGVEGRGEAAPAGYVTGEAAATLQLAVAAAAAELVGSVMTAAGKLDTAIDAARKALALTEEVHGQAHADLADIWELLADLYEAKEAWPDARNAIWPRPLPPPVPIRLAGGAPSLETE